MAALLDTLVSLQTARAEIPEGKGTWTQNDGACRDRGGRAAHAQARGGG
jgi:hypothetical protein